MIYFPTPILTIMDEDERSFMEKLYINHHITMFKVACSLVNSDQDAEDVVSETCVHLIKKISFLKHLDCNFLTGYIVSTVKNTAFSFHRKQVSLKEESIDDMYEKYANCKGQKSNLQITSFATNDDPLCIILQKVETEQLMDAIRMLSAADQTVIRMKYFERASDGDIAEILGIKPISVRSRLTRARDKILLILESENNAEK